ncbi:PepSY domain-containing protein [uncultured Nocardioides sp.]|uniref:PepSY-associated TM helix domain-containing protein n=1 Tax=uncultured Nocardioides sp. TaxID=198441 RepID=UPI00262ADB97|nr:PepSY domain-containing protein [uncultured Nocardioides sp.]
MALSTPETPTTGTPPDRPGSTLRPLIVRLHFYAAVLVAPFILVAAITGGLYAVATPLERVVHAEELSAPASGPALPLDEQVAAARAVVGDLPLVSVRPAADDEGGVGGTTRVMFDDGRTDASRTLAVFVDPASGEVRGELTSYGGSGSLPVRTWIDEMHRNLHLGEPGRLYSELAASWLGVVALAGLVLWWTGPRRSSRLRPLRKKETRSARRRTQSWHGSLGTWALLGMLMLSVTGLTWSTYAGANVTDLRLALGWGTPAVTSDLAADGGAGTGDHSGHGGHSETAEPEAVPDAPGIGFDGAVAAAADEGLSGPLEISQPVGATGTYVVSEIDSTWPTRADVAAVDPADGEVTDVVRFADWPLMARLASWGIDLHMGVLFGLVSQLALLLLAAAIVVMTVTGYRMWWQRRPTRGDGVRMGRAPRRGAWRAASPAALAGVGVVALAAGWFVPLLGVSLLGFLVLDVVLGLRSRRRATVVPQMELETDAVPEESR